MRLNTFLQNFTRARQLLADCLGKKGIVRMTEDELIEQVAGADRPASGTGELRYHPAWHDLDAAGARTRVRARARRLARLEAALDPDGLSTTARAVLAPHSPVIRDGACGSTRSTRAAATRARRR